jgi:hypothetical protein
MSWRRCAGRQRQPAPRTRLQAPLRLPKTWRASSRSQRRRLRRSALASSSAARPFSTPSPARTVRVGLTAIEWTRQLLATSHSPELVSECASVGAVIQTHASTALLRFYWLWSALSFPAERATLFCSFAALHLVCACRCSLVCVCPALAARLHRLSRQGDETMQTTHHLRVVFTDTAVSPASVS